MAFILLVDDEADINARNRAALEADGHEVAVASTAHEALAAIHVRRPDVIVLEALLDGGRAGFDLAGTIAAEFADLPMIMLSRIDEQLSATERALEDRDGWLPVQRFLEKPVMPEVLVYEIDHLLPASLAAGSH